MWGGRTLGWNKPAGVDPKEILLPHEFILNRDMVGPVPGKKYSEISYCLHTKVVHMTSVLK